MKLYIKQLKLTPYSGIIFSNDLKSVFGGKSLRLIIVFIDIVILLLQWFYVCTRVT